MKKINNIRDTFLTQYWISYIGFLLNVKDEDYLASESEFGKLEAEMENLKLKYFSVLNNLIFKEEIEKLIGKRPFEIAKNESILMSDSIFELKKTEKEWERKYIKLVSTSKVLFEEKEIKLAALSKYFTSDDRDKRKLAYDVRFKWFLDHEDEFDEIMDNLVSIRTKIANVLGFDSYTEVGYIKMNRIGYTKEDITKFRKQIEDYIVPLTLKLKEAQKERLGLDNFDYYDQGILFKNGNAKLDKSLEEIIDITEKMYKELSPELSEIFTYMKINKLLDLEMRENKSNGGITTYLPNYKVPFIVASYNGSNSIIRTLSHEFGHSVQLYLSKELIFHENRWPTFDICEIHANTLEYLIYDYLDLYFEKDSSKYKMEHLNSEVLELGYIAAIDEFQHVLYDEFDLSPKERKEKWKEIQNKYMPYIKNNHPYYEKGILWYKQSHVFCDPFYYIDYALDKACALSFYEKYKINKEKTLEDYIELCKLGGSLSFKNLIEKANLNNPFEKGSLKSVSQLLENEINELNNKIKN